jgi:nucleotide-binding universal stress UspA family protein
MQLIQKIMVAVDYSEYSFPLVQYTHLLAQSLGAKIILVNVYNQRDVSAIQKAVNPYDHELCDTLVRENIQQHRQNLDDLVEQAKAQDTVIEKIVRVGAPYQKLLEVIEEAKPDLLIMGTKGRSNLADTIVGSCAHKMYRKSPIPMLSLRFKGVIY